jgi:hypothetical protein
MPLPERGYTGMRDAVNSGAWRRNLAEPIDPDDAAHRAALKGLEEVGSMIRRGRGETPTRHPRRHGRHEHQPFSTIESSASTS